MRAALLIAAACATASADETYTTFGHDWGFSLAWSVIGQTMITPGEATVLESFDFVGEVNFDTVSYAITVYLWDDEGQHVVGDPLFGDFGIMHIGEDPFRHHDIGVLLPPDEKIAVVLSFEFNPGADHGVGATADVWENGSAIATTSGQIENPWLISENTINDLLFTAEWTVCTADVSRTASSTSSTIWPSRGSSSPATWPRTSTATAC